MTPQHAQYDGQAKKIKALEDENAELREALEFYADLSNWWEDWWQVIEQPPAAVADGGHNARTALQKQEKEKP